IRYRKFLCNQIVDDIFVRTEMTYAIIRAISYLTCFVAHGDHVRDAGIEDILKLMREVTDSQFIEWLNKLSDHAKGFSGPCETAKGLENQRLSP
ncbi:MAG: hypothetical protein WCI56_14295, partial [Hyphomicrobiales bacterium]